MKHSLCLWSQSLAKKVISLRRCLPNKHLFGLRYVSGGEDISTFSKEYTCHPQKAYVSKHTRMQRLCWKMWWGKEAAAIHLFGKWRAGDWLHSLYLQSTLVLAKDIDQPKTASLHSLPCNKDSKCQTLNFHIYIFHKPCPLCKVRHASQFFPQ